MNLKKLLIATTIVSSLSSTGLLAATEIQQSAIEEMGKWYGIALPCKYIEETRRIKNAMVVALPKQRYLGQIFEQATNKAFLEFANAGTACPKEGELARNIDASIESLNSAFAE